jgi:hypothetical protein
MDKNQKIEENCAFLGTGEADIFLKGMCLYNEYKTGKWRKYARKMK